MDRFAVIGLGRFGSRLATTLAAAGAEVIAIDARREIVEDLRDRVTLAIALDATDEQALKLQGVHQCDCAIVGIGHDFEANALTTVLLKQLGLKRVVSRAGNEMQAQILTRIGADGVVRPEDESADRWSHRLLAPFLMDHVELGRGYALVQVRTPEAWVGKPLSDLGLRQRHKVTIVAVRRPAPEDDPEGEAAERIVDVPLPDTKLGPDDILVIAGFNKDIERLPR